MKIRLTPAFVKKAAAELGAERTVYWDEGLQGFGLMVMASGSRSYVVQYRNARRQSRRMTLNSVLKLEAAKKQAMGILSAAAKGADPLAERKVVAGAATNTLKAVGDRYLSREGKGLRSIDQRRDHLERLVYPKLGNLQVEDVTRKKIVNLLDKIEDDSGPVMADAVLATIRRLLAWHAGRSDDFRSPIVRGMARSKPHERRRQRKLDDDEIRAVWEASHQGSGPFGAMVRFILLTATRRNEAADLQRSELTGPVWLIPGSRHKSKRDCHLPLSADAVAHLDTIPRVGRKSATGFVFTTDGKRGIRGFSKFKKQFDKDCGVTGWTIHDLRRTARSLMSRAGVDPDHAERALGHVITGVRGTYDVHEFQDEKLAAFEALAGQIRRILNPVENVVSPRGSAQ
jgi:integrase